MEPTFDLKRTLSKHAQSTFNSTMPLLDVTNQHNLNSVVEMLQTVEDITYAKFRRPLDRTSLLREANHNFSADLRLASQ
jgi:hypothetical protein